MMQYDWNEEIKQDIQKFIHNSHPDTHYMGIFIPAYRAPDLLKYLHDKCPEVDVDEARYLEKPNAVIIHIHKKEIEQ